MRTLAKLLHILELNLTMNEELIELINAARVLEIIRWIEEHYNGELVEWSSIGQLIIMLHPEGEWRQHLSETPEKSFWLLGIDDFGEPSAALVFSHIGSIVKNMGKY